MATNHQNGIPVSYAQTIIAGEYRQHDKYEHYQSAEFRASLFVSVWFFRCLVRNRMKGRAWPKIRSWDPPNTPDQPPPDYMLSQYGYQWGPDEDFYISWAEGYLF